MCLGMSWGVAPRFRLGIKTMPGLRVGLNEAGRRGMLAAFSFAGRDWESAESACRIKGLLLSETGVKNFWLDALDGNHRSWASNRPNKQACMTKQGE